MNDHLDRNLSGPTVAQPVDQAAAINPGPGSAKHIPDFQTIEMRLRSQEVGPNVLLNIPIWGWTGAGKTCSLLTAIHFSDAAQHPLGFALVNDTDELSELEAANEDYKYLNLVSTAESTTERFRALSEQFIDRNDWPPGTDELSSYILAIRNFRATLGYAIFPDLKGGSYREIDGSAREVLKRAHAVVMLVNPELYVSQAVEGKQYRDGILAQLQRCNKALVPVCVMITKADLHQGPHQATDSTHTALTMLLQRQDGLNYHLARVSVVGLDHSLAEGNKLPPVQERNPIELIHAWNWVVTEALCRPEGQIRELVPAVNIQSVSDRTKLAKVRALPELRSVGEFSDAPGKLLCASGNTPNDHAFTFLSEQGELFETKVPTGPSEIPAFQHIGDLKGWEAESDSEVCGYYIGGEYYIGNDNTSVVNSIWCGVKGGSLQQISTPFELSAWVPVGNRRLVALDAKGRIHLLKFDGIKMVQTDYIDKFIPESTALICLFEDANSRITAMNGTDISCVLLGSDDHFGSQVAPSLRNAFDSCEVVTNRLGGSLAISSAGKVTISGPSKPIDLGTHPSITIGSMALAALAPIAGIVTEDLRLVAHLAVGETTRPSDPNLSPTLHERPLSLGWSMVGDLLIATFSDKTWRVFRPFGLA